MHNIGIKFIIKNFDYWVWVSLWPAIMIPKELSGILKNKISKKFKTE